MSHTLTASWYKTSISNYVTVNDEKVDVPYELKNGDIIKIYTNNGDSAGCLINGENSSWSFHGSIDLSDTDINYTEVNWGPAFEISTPVITINYTEQSIPSYPKINSFTYHGKQMRNINGKPIRYVHDKRAGMDNTYEMVYVLQLAAPQNVTAAGTTVSWDAVENATSYAVLADGTEIGTVEVAANLISFTIAGTSYQAEEGMTWGEWVNSGYNTSGYYVRQDGVITNNIYFVSTPAGHVSSTDTIVSDYSYAGGGAGGGGK